MKTTTPFSIFLLLTFCCIFSSARAQVSSPVKELFPEGTKVFENVSYAGDTLQRHLMDVYLPQHAQCKIAASCVYSWWSMDA